MAKYNVTYKCGCTETISLVGKIADRERKIEWYKTVECPHCRALAAQSEAKSNDMVNLEGSEKQIAWASDIREKAVNVVEKFMAEAVNREMAQKLVDMMMAESKASYWIDNRYSVNGSVTELAMFLLDSYKTKL